MQRFRAYHSPLSQGSVHARNTNVDRHVRGRTGPLPVARTVFILMASVPTRHPDTRHSSLTPRATVGARCSMKRRDALTLGPDKRRSGDLRPLAGSLAITRLPFSVERIADNCESRCAGPRRMMLRGIGYDRHLSFSGSAVTVQSGCSCVLVPAGRCEDASAAASLGDLQFGSAG